MMHLRTPAEERDFLLYYAGVLTREAKARPGQDVQWMIDGASRARLEAASIDLTTAQGRLL